MPGDKVITPADAFCAHFLFRDHLPIFRVPDQHFGRFERIDCHRIGVCFDLLFRRLFLSIPYAEKKNGAIIRPFQFLSFYNTGVLWHTGQRVRIQDQFGWILIIKLLPCKNQMGRLFIRVILPFPQYGEIIFLLPP